MISSSLARLWGITACFAILSLACLFYRQPTLVDLQASRHHLFSDNLPPKPTPKPSPHISSNISYAFATRNADAIPEQLVKGLPAGARYYFAMLLTYDLEPLLRHTLGQLEALIPLLGTNDVFISVVGYRTGDATKAILLDFIQRLHSQSVESHIEFIKADANLSRPALWNRVLSPLNSHKNALSGARPFDRIVFVDQIYFSIEELLLLDSSTLVYSADIVCGMELGQLSRPRSLKLQFLDLDTTRDIHGNYFSQEMPYTYDFPSQQALARGAPFQVYSCWSGLAIVNLQRFDSAAQTTLLTFRQPNVDVDDCNSASEFFTLCSDLWDVRRLQSQPLVVLVHPLVRLSRDATTWQYIKGYQAIAGVSNSNLPLPKPVFFNITSNTSVVCCPRHIASDDESHTAKTDWCACYREWPVLQATTGKKRMIGEWVPNAMWVQPPWGLTANGEPNGFAQRLTVIDKEKQDAQCPDGPDILHKRTRPSNAKKAGTSRKIPF